MNRNYSNISYAESPFGTLSEFMSKSFGWMFAGLLVTFGVGIGAVASGLIFPIINSGLFIFTSIAELVMVFVLSARVQKLQPSTATALFFGYAVLNGINLSSIFLVYSISDIGVALVLCAAFFFVLTMFSLTTKFDMLKAGPILMVGLVVLIISQIVLMFVPGSTTGMRIICAFGLILFAGMTLYDAQQTRALFSAYEAQGPEMIKKISIICALNLYLDFVNMFLYILQLFGSRD